MSERDESGRDPQRSAEQEAFDARVSAAIDGALDPAARAALEREIAADPALAARAQALHDVDAGLRTLAADPIAADRLERNFEALQARLGSPAAAVFANTADTANTADAANPALRGWLRRAGVPILTAAAAAAAVLYLWLPRSADPGATPAPARMAGAASEVEKGGASARPSDEAVAIALGYGEDPATWQLAPGVPIDDLEIIEELELLEYLATHETEGRG